MWSRDNAIIIQLKTVLTSALKSTYLVHSCMCKCTVYCIQTGSQSFLVRFYPNELTMWRAERVISRIEGYDWYMYVVHSVVGGAIMIELLLTLVAKHGKN